jgi:hypothetical protein
MSAPGAGAVPGSGATGGQYLQYQCRNHNAPGHSSNYTQPSRPNESCQNCQVSQKLFTISTPVDNIQLRGM